MLRLKKVIVRLSLEPWSFFAMWLCAFGIADGWQCVCVLWLVHNVTYICYTIVQCLYRGSIVWIYCTYIGGQVCEYILPILVVKYVNVLYLYWGQVCEYIVPILGVKYVNVLYLYWGSSMWIYCTYIGDEVCEYIVRTLGVKYVTCVSVFPGTVAHWLGSWLLCPLWLCWFSCC